MTLNSISRLALLGLITSLCGLLGFSNPDKIDYKSAGKAPTLEVPPDLTQLSRDNRYALPGGPVSANSYQAGIANAPALPTAVSSVADVRMERAGTERWLVVNRPADQLWEPVRDFWQESGFLLTTDQRNLGIMETDWAENRGKLPQDIIRGTVGKLVDSVYSTGELDRFRTRMERTPNGTEIYISHRGMEEVYSTVQKDQTVWQPRRPDPELEAEFLRRLMVKLGVSQEQSQALVAAAAAPGAKTSVSSTPSTASRWCRSTKASTVHGAASASRSIAPASPWKTATAPPARTSCAISRRTRTRNLASLPRCSRWARRASPIRRSSSASRSRARAKPAPPWRCSTTTGAPDAPRPTRKRIVKVIADDLK